jgi:parvulin-like peptidyl-prolyl isomerase
VAILMVGWLAALLLAACGQSVLTPPPPSGPAPDTAPTDPATEVAATVNGQPITVDSFRAELARFEAGRTALGFEVADQGSYEQQVLDLLIEQELIRQLAGAQGIAVTDAEVDAVINGMIADTGQEYFDAWLAESYYTPEEFREVIRLDLTTQQLIAPIVDGIPTVTEQVHARHILVNTQSQAEEVLARLQAGEDFGALAAEYSVDVTARDNGGDLGWFPRGGLLVPEVEEAAFGLQPGQTSGAVQSALGFHVIQTLEFDPARPVEEDQRDLMVRRAIETWRLGLRSGANVEQLITLSS